MQVTSIVSLDKKRSRVLFDRDLALVLYPGDMRAFHIEEGSELSEESYRQLLETVLKPRARERILKVLLVSDKTEKQLSDLLKREGYPEEAVNEAVSMVKTYHYIDDEAYALRYIETQGRRKSKRALACDMEKKGFSREQIRKLLEEHPIDEKAQILALLAGKGYHPGESLDRARYAKLAGMLARKGYSYEAISEALREPEQEI